MNDAEIPQGTQQAGDTIQNTNNFIESITDQGSSLQGTVGSSAAEAVMQVKGSQHEEGNNSRGGSNTQRHRNSTNDTPRACTTCQQTNRKESSCRCTSYHKDADPTNYVKRAFRPHERRDSIRIGHVYRIWKPENATMHLSTVLIIIDRARSWSACKFVQEKDVDNDFNYKEYCAPIHEHTTDHPCTEVNRYIKQRECHPLTIYPASTQKLHPKCYVDLERSYDLGNEDDYEFVFCGTMDKKSFKYAKEKHLELYSD